MILSSVPVTILGALLLATYGNSAPLSSNADNSRILRIPMDMVAAGPLTPNMPLTDIEKRTVKADMNEFFYAYSLMMKIKAGPGDQEINLSVDTGSAVTWTNPQCSTAGAFADVCEKLKVYQPQGEPISKGLNARYGIGEATISIYSTDVKLGGLTVDKFLLGVATSSRNLATGILGLSPPGADQQKYSLLQTLANKKHIESRAFSIDVGYTVNAGPPVGDSRGSVIFGGIDSKKFSGRLETVKLLPYDDLPKYRVKLDTLSITMRDFTKSVNGRDVTLDTGASHHYFPTKMIQGLEKDYGAENRDGILWVPCVYKKQEGGITLQFGGTKIVTPVSELVADPMKVGDSWCHTRIAESKNDRILLGLPFFRSAYTVFDQDNGQFYVAKAANCGSSLEKIVVGPNGVPLQGKC